MVSLLVHEVGHLGNEVGHLLYEVSHLLYEVSHLFYGVSPKSMWLVIYVMRWVQNLRLFLCVFF